MGTVDMYAAAALGAAALTDRLAEPPREVRWRAGWEVDAWLRDELVLGTREARTIAARASDGTVALLTAQPFADAALAGLVYQSPDVAWQMAAISFTAIMFNAASTGLVKRLGGRERPIATACRTDPDYDDHCGERPPRSFSSGHASAAFTAAGLTCIHHAHLPLYGRGWDELACATAMFAASTVAYERVISDRHYVSDVVMGAAMGTFSGAFLPWLFYYQFDAVPGRGWMALPSVSDREIGVRGMAIW